MCRNLHDILARLADMLLRDYVHVHENHLPYSKFRGRMVTNHYKVQSTIHHLQESSSGTTQVCGYLHDTLSANFAYMLFTDCRITSNRLAHRIQLQKIMAPRYCQNRLMIKKELSESKATKED